jgi:zinc protease
MAHKSQADFVAGRVAVARSHPDFYALNLANLLFGRIGLYGRLGTTVRDTLGLAYYSFSSLEARLAGGHWSLSAGVNPKNLVKAVQAIRAEAERLNKEPFTEQEIRDGKTHLVGALQVNLERNPEYAGALHDVEYHALGSDYLDRYPALVRGIDPDSVRKKAVAYFDPDACAWVASGPIGGMKIAF